MLFEFNVPENLKPLSSRAKHFSLGGKMILDLKYDCVALLWHYT